MIPAIGATARVAFLGYVVLAALAVGFGLLLTRELLRGAVGDWDIDATTWLVVRRTSTRDDLSLYGSYVSETLTVIVVTVVSFVWLSLQRHWRQLVIIGVAMAVEGATYLTATYVVTRHRPAVPRLEDLIVADSYFSGHVAASVALYGSLAVVVWSLTHRTAVRAAFAALAIVAPIVVGLSRMYRGMHYLSDVTIGALVGLGCIVVALIAVRAGVAALPDEAPAEHEVIG
jgi:membrane-associated phospholipid phosphatase